VSDGGIPGPAPKRRKVHKAAKINENGDVSALCFEPPRAINMKTQTWTLTDRFVTCGHCRSMLRALAA
jgi:hypothetical protein